MGSTSTSSRDSPSVHAVAARLAVHDGKRVRFVKVRDVTQIVAAGFGVVVHVAGRAIPWRVTLAHLEATLDRASFFRASRSVLVNTKRVRELRAAAGGVCEIVLDDGVVVHSSRGFRELLAMLEPSSATASGGRRCE